jgi:hypothetical protein
MLAMRIDFMVSPLQISQPGPVKVEAVFGYNVISVG